MIGLDRVVRIPLHGVQRRGDQFIEHPHVGRSAVGGDLGRDGARAERPGEEPPGSCQVTPVGQQDIDDLTILIGRPVDRKSTRLNSSHPSISYAVFCLKKKNNKKLATHTKNNAKMKAEEK